MKHPLTTPALIIDHFYIGVCFTVFYVLFSPAVLANGYPGFAALLAGELLILAPIGLTHLFSVGYRLNHRFSLKDVIGFKEKLSVKAFFLWTLAGIAAIALIYAPLYPAGLWLRQSVFDWLPEWYFNPTFGTENLQLIMRIMLAGVFIDGIIGPVIEELFFRGYLLPRMSRFGKWAPILNGGMFGLYHFWQPHNILAIIGVGIILSWIVWKTKNVYLGIAIHCSINLIGAIGGYLAASGGVLIGR